MTFRDEILVGDDTIGNYIVGFFSKSNCIKAERKIIKAYQDLCYVNVRPVWTAHTLSAVKHEGMDPNAIFTDDSSLAYHHFINTCGDDFQKTVEMTNKYCSMVRYNNLQTVFE